MKKIFIFYLLLISSSHFILAQTYTLVSKKSQLLWEGKKVTGKHNGTIQFQSGILKKENKKITGQFSIDMNTIEVLDIKNPKYNKKLRDHLMSSDFFDTNKYKFSTLKITDIKKDKKTKKQYIVHGVLTIKGISKKISFPANIQFQKKSFIANGKLEVDRTLYNIRYGSGKFFKKLGDKLIFDNFHIEFQVKGKTNDKTNNK